MLTKYKDHAHRERFRDTPLRKLFSTAWQASVSKEALAPVNETLPEGAIILPIYNGEVASRWIHELSLPESLLVRATSNLLEIRLMNGAVVDRPIVIYHVTEGQDAAVQVDFNIVVTAEEGSQASFLLVEAGNGEYLNLGTMSVSLAESANIEFVHAGINSKAGSSLFDFVATQATESQLHYMSYQSQGAITRSDIAFSVEGEGAYSELNVLNIAEGREHISHVVDLDHKVPNCSSNQQVKNILKDRAEALFDAQIHVFQDAQKIDADQMTRSLLLNDGARALTIPRLLIYADDVRCTHGATVGFIEPDHLFYLRSRGISAEEAKKMLIRAYAVEIVDTIRSESIRDWLAHRLDHDIAILL